MNRDIGLTLIGGAHIAFIFICLNVELSKQR